MLSSNSHSPCAACKFLRRKCTQECVFAPYFPAEQPQKFASVHRVYGASNVAKILHDLPVAHREEAVVSLAYEAEARLRDPVYGCVGLISYLHSRLKQVHSDTLAANNELAAYIGSSSSSSSSAAVMVMNHPNYPSLLQHHQLQAYPSGNFYGLHQQQAMFPAGPYDGGEGYPPVVQVHHQQQHDYHNHQNVVIDHQPPQLLLNNIPHQHQHPGGGGDIKENLEP